MLKVESSKRVSGETQVLNHQPDIPSGETTVTWALPVAASFHLLRCPESRKPRSPARFNYRRRAGGTTARSSPVRRCVIFASRSRGAQQFNLFPNYTALKNVALALTLNSTALTRRRSCAHELLFAKVGRPDKTGPHPESLSRQQQLAIARAPGVGTLLFDEPTSALDPELRPR